MGKFAEILRQSQPSSQQSEASQSPVSIKAGNSQKPGRKAGSGKRSQEDIVQAQFLLKEETSLDLDDFVSRYNREARANDEPKIDRSDVVQMLLEGLLEESKGESAAAALIKLRYRQ